MLYNNFRSRISKGLVHKYCTCTCIEPDDEIKFRMINFNDRLNKIDIDLKSIKWDELNVKLLMMMDFNDRLNKIDNDLKLIKWDEFKVKLSMMENDLKLVKFEELSERISVIENNPKLKIMPADDNGIAVIVIVVITGVIFILMSENF